MCTIATLSSNYTKGRKVIVKSETTCECKVQEQNQPCSKANLYAAGLVHAKGEGGGEGREGRRWRKMWRDGERREREGGGVMERGEGEGRRRDGGRWDGERRGRRPIFC